MAEIVYRGNLSSKAFPLLTDFHGRTVITPGPDNTFNRSLTSPEDVDKDVGVPIVYYCHNVLPAPYGFHSVGYEQLIPGLVNSTVFGNIKLLRANTISSTVPGSKYYFSPTPAGVFYIINLGQSIWKAAVTVIPYSSVVQLTYATVQGISYVFIPGVGCYKYDVATNTLIAVTLQSLNPTALLGITAYQGYLIAYDVSAIYYSSTLDIDYTLNIIDFTPSLVTGAGSLKPEGTRAQITVVVAATFGIAIYTSANVVSGIYSGNSRFPFNFREIVASGGCASPDLITYDAQLGNQYAYTTSGVQVVTATATTTVFPELTDFLAGQDFEDFDETTLKFTQQVLSFPLKKKLTSIADRYLIFSYGINALTHAIIYDMVQKRYGKLKVTHVDCIEWAYFDILQSDAPRRSIAFLQQDGKVIVVNPSVTFAQSFGVILLGKFQYVRSRLLSLEGVEIQAVHSNQAVKLYNYSSNTGGTVESQVRKQGYDVSVSGEFQKSYKFHTTAINHSIMLVGGFFLSSFILRFKINGKR